MKKIIIAMLALASLPASAKAHIYNIIAKSAKKP